MRREVLYMTAFITPVVNKSHKTVNMTYMDLISGVHMQQPLKLQIAKLFCSSLKRNPTKESVRVSEFT